MTALFSGVVVGACMLGRFDITDAVLLPSLGSKSAAGVVLFYLWLLGGLMGFWWRTGAAQTFAEFMTRHFVKGPRSAKFVSWVMGVLFFSGRNRQRGFSRNDRQASRRFGESQSRRTFLDRRFHSFAHRIDPRVQRLARLRSGLPRCSRGRFSRDRGRSYLLLFQKRSFEFLRNPRGPRHTLAQPRYHPFLRPRDSRGARTSQDHRSTRRARSAANECERAAGEPCSQRIQSKRPRILFSLFLLLGTAIGTFILWGVRK